MSWDVVDFAVFAMLIVGTGTAYKLATRRSVSVAYRFGIGIALAAAFLLVWVNAAVGIIGDEGNDANVMYFGVLAIGITGAIFVRCKPAGMVRVLYAMAGAQVLAAVIGLSAGFGSTGPIWPRDVLYFTGFFSLLWLISARLFRLAEQRQLQARSGPDG